MIALRIYVVSLRVMSLGISKNSGSLNYSSFFSMRRRVRLIENSYILAKIVFSSLLVIRLYISIIIGFTLSYKYNKIREGIKAEYQT